jgi:hypothetical protein
MAGLDPAIHDFLRAQRRRCAGQAWSSPRMTGLERLVTIPVRSNLLARVYGEAELNKDSAIQIRDLALNATFELSRALSIAKTDCSPEEFEKLRFSIGSVIGRIEIEVLSDIYRQHSDLDDIKV